MIVYKPPANERAAQPASFTFDKVFGPAFLTEAVYEEGVKNVALSALMGINATIFAYGQTSSGKTYTMRGITEKAVNDIYKHIMNVSFSKDSIWYLIRIYWSVDLLFYSFSETFCVFFITKRACFVLLFGSTTLRQYFLSLPSVLQFNPIIFNGSMIMLFVNKFIASFCIF
ncbi:hypothetical protein S245_017607 [Arachis hypogaea]